MSHTIRVTDEGAVEVDGGGPPCEVWLQVFAPPGQGLTMSGRARTALLDALRSSSQGHRLPEGMTAARLRFVAMALDPDGLYGGSEHRLITARKSELRRWADEIESAAPGSPAGEGAAVLCPECRTMSENCPRPDSEPCPFESAAPGGQSSTGDGDGEARAESPQGLHEEGAGSGSAPSVEPSDRVVRLTEVWTSPGVPRRAVVVGWHQRDEDSEPQVQVELSVPLSVLTDPTQGWTPPKEAPDAG